MARQTIRRCGRVSVALVLAAAVRAGANEFAATPAGNFTDASSWDVKAVPGPNDDAIIDNGATATIRSGDTINVMTLQAGESTGSTGTLIMNGNVDGSGTTVNVDASSQNSSDNAIAIGEFGVGHFIMNGGTINLGSLTTADDDFHVGKSSMGSTMVMNGGIIRTGSAFRVARGQDANASATVTLNGGEIDVGSGIVVARGNNGDTNTADGTFIVQGTARFISGNDMGVSNSQGITDEGYFSIANRTLASGHVTVAQTGTVMSLRLTARQGHGDLTVQDNGRFMVVNTLGASSSAPGLYNSYLGGGSSSNGDGDNGASGVFNLTLKGTGLLDVDANASGRDVTRPDLQGFVLARGNSTVTATIQDNATLNVHQRFVIGGLGQNASMNGFDGIGNPDPSDPTTPQNPGDPGMNPGGTATVNMTGGTISTDHLIVGGTGTGTLNLSGGTAGTKAYNQTFDPTANAGAGSDSTSVNCIRIGFSMGSTGTVNVSGSGALVAGADLDVGHYGTGTLTQTGGSVSAGANLYLAKFAGSTGTYTLSGGTLTTPNVLGGQGSSTFNFNGGTLIAAADSANFIQGVGAVHVQGGGANVDTNGHNVTISQNLTADGAGGLNKNGAGTLTLTGVNTYSGGTMAGGGTLVVGSGTALPAASALSIGAAGAVRIAKSTPAIVESLASLTIDAGGKLDVTNATIQIAYGNGPSPDATIAALVLAGKQKTAGIFSSSAAANMVIGYLDNGSTHTELIKPTLFGDINLDGKVNNSDYFQFNKSFGKSVGQSGFNPQFDFNNDGKVNNTDYFQFNKNFGMSLPGPAPAAALAVTSVPEPGALALLASAGVALLRRSRARSSRV